MNLPPLPSFLTDAVFAQLDRVHPSAVRTDVAGLATKALEAMPGLLKGVLCPPGTKLRVIIEVDHPITPGVELRASVTATETGGGSLPVLEPTLEMFPRG